MPNETIIADGDQLADEAVGLDAAAAANGYALLNFNEWPHESAVSNLAAVDVDRFDDGDTLSKFHVNDPGFL